VVSSVIEPGARHDGPRALDRPGRVVTQRECGLEQNSAEQLAGRALRQRVDQLLAARAFENIQEEVTS